MSDKIILTGIEVFGRHGCSFEEQRLGQFFKVDVELDTNLSTAGKSDNLDDAVDYAQVMFMVEQIVSGKPRRLIETVAEEIAAEILNRYDKVDCVKVTLHKPNAPLPIKYADAAVEIVRDRKITTPIQNENEFKMFGVMTTDDFGVNFTIRDKGKNAGCRDWRIDGNRHYKGKDVTMALAREVFFERYNAAKKSQLDNDDSLS